MTGVEIDLVVTDSLKALAQYEKIFDVQRLEVTALSQGKNEAVFSIYGTRFHLLDENPDYHMIAPRPEQPQSVWFNVVVPDIREILQKALDAGCTEIQPVTPLPEMGVSNAIFADSFGYTWLLHQIYRNVSFEDRCRIMEKMME